MKKEFSAYETFLTKEEELELIQKICPEVKSLKEVFRIEIIVANDKIDDTDEKYDVYTLKNIVMLMEHKKIDVENYPQLQFTEYHSFIRTNLEGINEVISKAFIKFEDIKDIDSFSILKEIDNKNYKLYSSLSVRNVTCSICGKNAQEAVAKNPDNHAGGTSIADAKEATCQTAGYTGDTVCAGCGAVLSKGQEIPATGNHTFGEWTAVKAATCQEGGTEERVCSGCGEKETREIPKTEHDYTAEVKAPTCTDAGYTVYICSVCGDTYTGDRTSALGHSYDANGVCIRCGYVKVSSIEFTSSSKLTADSTKKTVTSKNLLTVKELTAQIKTTGWTVTTADGKAVSESSSVGTGYILKNTSGNLAYTMVIIGDVNCDGKVNASDARFALRVSAKLEKTDDYTGAAADVDGNSKVTAADARTILRVAAKLDTF